MFLSGQVLSKNILQATALQIKEAQLKPGLGVILVGADAASHLYVCIKEKRAHELGIFFEKKIFSAQADSLEIEKAIAEMNENPQLHGIIVQLPLPAHLDTERIIRSIDPNKDTDGFHPITIEQFLAGDQTRLPVFPRAMLELTRLKASEKKTNEEALAIVNSDLMGRVLQAALTSEGYKAQYVFGTETETIQSLVAAQSVIFTAVGTPDVISATNAMSGAVWVDGGIYYDTEGEVVGDITRDDGVYRDDVFVTPVPGGVGPVTVAVLLARVTEAALNQKNTTS